MIKTLDGFLGYKENIYIKKNKKKLNWNPL